ncbi:hypothetical protein A9Q81_19095 [Gammaproteobacteria bacterium 42_54_T18]|nr:hypothetical protein A9Q81_19095 [Gammaproteobacteria bacterium 42_54_T18]
MWPVWFYTGLCLVLIAVITPAQAADRPNILIMGEDVDGDTVARNSQVFHRVLNALSNQLHDVGFDVFDETAVTLENFVQGRVRRTDAELIDIAKSIRRPPIDVVVLFSIYSTAYQHSYTTKVKVRIEGRLLNVQTGQRLGNVELDYPEGWNAPQQCNRDCLLRSIGDHSKIIANDVGSVLAEKLSWMVNRSDPPENEGNLASQGVGAYQLIFDDFTQAEVMEFEEYLVIFSGYESHRITYGGATRTEYWYKSNISNAKLSRNLNKLLETLNVSGLVQISGNTYTVKKISLRYSKPARNPRDW